MRLAGHAQDKDFRLNRHTQLISTNDEALRCGRVGDPGRLWIVAETQSGGRGRNGRVWESPAGNLHASLLLIDPAPLRRAPELGFVVGVALAQALREVLQGDPRLTIKWPNDMLYGGAKLAGILLESSQLPDGRLACVAGIGVNCGWSPQDALYEATDLGAILGRSVGPEPVFELLARAIPHWLEVWDGGANFEAVRAQWLALAAGVGLPIKVSRSSGSCEGVFRTIDATGRLILDQAAGQIAIEAGDVFLLARPGETLAALQ